MTEEQKTQTNQELEAPATALLVVTENQPILDEKSLNIKPLMYIYEAIRRVFPSKQKLTLDQIKRFIRTEGFFPVQNGDDEWHSRFKGKCTRFTMTEYVSVS